MNIGTLRTFLLGLCACAGLAQTAFSQNARPVGRQPDGSYVVPTGQPVLAQVPVGTYPYATAVSRDGSKVYVSNWGGRIPGPNDTTDGTYPVVVDPRTGIPISGTVSIISAASNQVVKTITVDRHPCGMALSPAGDRLYVTNANSDTVSVIDTASDEVVKNLSVSLTSTRVGHTKVPVLGSSPNAVAVSPDGATLYVANASDNAIAVLDLNSSASSPVLGFIPTGWYPAAVATSASGRNLVVANSYGFGSVAPLTTPGTGRSYTDRKGVISILPVPDSGQLATYTQQVRQNSSVLPASATITAANNNPIPLTRGGQSPIKAAVSRLLSMCSTSSKRIERTTRSSAMLPKAMGTPLWLSSDRM